eukprot:6181085-Pleurochrysis_carterae.AAC.2
MQPLPQHSKQQAQHGPQPTATTQPSPPSAPPSAHFNQQPYPSTPNLQLNPSQQQHPSQQVGHLAWSNAPAHSQQQHPCQLQPVQQPGHAQQYYGLPPHHHQQQQYCQQFPNQHHYFQPQLQGVPPMPYANAGHYHGAPLNVGAAGTSSAQPVTPDSERALAKSIRMLSSA